VVLALGSLPPADPGRLALAQQRHTTRLAQPPS
jgi:hypothetical protein